MRICYVPAPPAAVWKAHPHVPNGGHFKGYFLAVTYNLYLEVVSKAVSNLTVSAASKFGQQTDPAHGKYDGCLGMLQHNESDLILGDVPFRRAVTI